MGFWVSGGLGDSFFCLLLAALKWTWGLCGISSLHKEMIQADKSGMLGHVNEVKAVKTGFKLQSSEECAPTSK